MDSHMASNFWSLSFKLQQINVLEMEAVLLARQAFVVHVGSFHVASYRQHNSGCQAMRTNRGIHSQTLCNLAVELALWCALTKFTSRPDIYLGNSTL